MANGFEKLILAGWSTWFASASLALVLGCGSSSHGFPATGGSAGSGTGGSGGSACTQCGGAPSGGSGGSGQGAECTAKSDCVGRTDGALACDVATGTCVACVTSSDCSASQDCVTHACVQAKSCTNSLNCGMGQVCDTAKQRCVECVTTADCNAGSQCAGDICRTSCSSDKACTALGMLCNRTLGYCVSCISASDCPTAQYCDLGTCTPDVCAAGTSSCAANSVVTCNADGSGTLPPVTCASTQTCVRNGGGASCVDQVCVPDVRGCQAGTEKIVVCSSDGLSQQTTEDCATSGQVCVAAACKPVVCVANGYFCSDSTAGPVVNHCSAKGDSSVIVRTCGSGQFCNASTGTCDQQLCAPNQPACNAEVATTCNSNGSGYVTGGTDCGSSGQHCVAGTCKDQVCSPSTRFCAAGVIELCSADGLSSSVYQTCGSNQYCDAATVTCKAQVCSPTKPACNGNTATTCNADGSGYVTGGTDCGTQYCVSGTCQDAIFTENFEDGDYAGWTAGTGSYVRSVTNTTAANGTTYSLVQTSSSYGTLNGLYHTLPNVQPTHIGYWVRPTSSVGESAEVAIESGTYHVEWFWFSTSYVYTFNGAYYTPFTLNQWCHIEMRNIDWTAKTYDWYVNDVLIHAATPFYSSSATSVTRIDLFNYYPATSYWDEIVMN